MTPIKPDFWTKADLLGPDDCWLWRGYVNPNGYGSHSANGRTCLAHRFAYELAKGPIPQGLVIDHLCQRRSCVNPAHLEAVTQSVNASRGYAGQVSAARFKEQSRRRTHCANGHEMTSENTYVAPAQGWPQCRACKREWDRRRRERCRTT